MRRCASVPIGALRVLRDIPLASHDIAPPEPQKPTILETKVSKPSLLYLAPSQKAERCPMNISTAISQRGAFADH